MILSKQIINWYKKNKRDLPWRNTNDSYFIWLSEIIMQQTRVEQGLPYYLKFTTQYPTIKKLARAKDDDVLKLWQGLGYYNRAANMLKTARAIVEEHDSMFPNSYIELIKLVGIGPYTAAAISSFAFNEPRAVVDGNVSRVLSRLFLIDEPINSSKGKKVFEEIANEIIDKKNPGLHNQAIMELGAMVCKPRQPLCEECPVRMHCEALKGKSYHQFPVKKKKLPPKNRYVNYIFVEQKGKTFIIQRTEKEIWKGLYELPNFDSEKDINEHELLKSSAFKKLFKSVTKPHLEKIFSVKHQLSHQTIYADFFKLTAKQKINMPNKSFIYIDIDKLQTYAVPRLFDKFLNYLNLHSNQK